MAAVAAAQGLSRLSGETEKEESLVRIRQEEGRREREQDSRRIESEKGFFFQTLQSEAANAV